MSNIDPSGINKNFPVAGQDNDTQVFRDNFTSIYDNFGIAKTEIKDLQDNVARTDTLETDFLGNTISNVILKNTSDAIVPGTSETSTSDIQVEFQSGSYQVFILKETESSFIVNLSAFPSDSTSVGKVTLELYSKGNGTKQVTFSLTGTGATNKKKRGFPTISGSHDLEVTSETNPVIVEIWRHNLDNFYFNYIGVFE